MNDDIAYIPYYAHEGIVSLMDRCNKRLCGALIAAVSVVIVETIILAGHKSDETDTGSVQNTN